MSKKKNNKKEQEDTAEKDSPLEEAKDSPLEEAKDSPLEEVKEEAKEEAKEEDDGFADGYIPLSDLVIKLKSVTQKKYKDQYFQDILDRIDPLIKKISYKYNVAGHDSFDIYQEALFALRFKAIRDFDIERTHKGDKVSFEKFASLCVKRHLSTLLKTSFQNKKYTLNSSISMHAERSLGAGEDTGTLADIIAGVNENDLDRVIREEQFSLIVVELLKVLSSFEKKVLLLYAQKYSYKEISDIINESREKVKINIKGVDNALSRIKIKARTLLDKLNEEFDEPIYPC